MYTYLNQRYGLKNLIIEWAAAIIAGIKNYQKEDHDVALFGKILRSECDEEFRFIQQTVKETVIALLRALFREKNPLKTETALMTIVENVLNGTGYVESWQWRKIIEKMYDDEDQHILEQQLLAKIHSQESDQPAQKKRSTTPNTNRTKQMRSEANQQSADKSRLKFHVFLKCVLDFQLREHEKFLHFFVTQFKAIDSDRDGVINEAQFTSLLSSLGFRDDYAREVSQDFSPSRIDKFLQVIDPYSNNKITFSECVHLLSSEMVVVPAKNDEMQQMAILEHLSTVSLR